MAAPTRTPSKPVEGTIVFTDIVGFTDFTATRGDAEALQLLATQDRLVQSALPDGARVVKEIGDGLLLWFPDPVDRSATAPSRSTAASRRSRRRPDSRCGSGSGCTTARALQRGADVIGHDVNVAARIVDVAAPGEVLVSDAVHAGVDPGAAHVCFTELGTGRDEGHPRAHPALARDRLLTSRGVGPPRPPPSAVVGCADEPLERHHRDASQAARSFAANQRPPNVSPMSQPCSASAAGPDGCWCMFWRLRSAEWRAGDPTQRKAALADRLAESPPPGVLGYFDDRPVGWCAVAPRHEYPRMQSSPTFGPVDDTPSWAVSCLFIHRTARRRGVGAALVAAAVAMAKAHGAPAVDAIPVAPGGRRGSGDLYTGTPSMFAAARVHRDRPTQARAPDRPADAALMARFEQRRVAGRGRAHQPRSAAVRRCRRDEARPGRLPRQRARPDPPRAARPAVVGDQGDSGPSTVHAEERARSTRRTGWRRCRCGRRRRSAPCPTRCATTAGRCCGSPTSGRSSTTPRWSRADRLDRATHLVLDLDPPAADAVRAGGRGRPSRAPSARRRRPRRRGEDQRRQGRARLRADRSAGDDGGRGGRDPGDRTARRAPRPADGHDGVRQGRPRRQGVRRLHPRPAAPPWSRPTARGPVRACRCRSRSAGTSSTTSRRATSRSSPPPSSWAIAIRGPRRCPRPSRFPADLIAEGHEIPIARVAAMHEGKRRARAQRDSAE